MEARPQETPAFALRGVLWRRGPDFALDLPELTFAAERIHAVVGPNGGGKTSLLRLLNFLDAPDRGRVEFFGRSYAPRSAAPARRRMAFVMQHPYLFRGAAAANVAYGLRVRGAPAGEIEPRVARALRRMGLERLAARRAKSLSGGEQKRLALAMALALEPEVLLLDEPTAHVDREWAERIEEEIHSLHQQRVVVVLTTHDWSFARRLTDAVVALDNGRLAPAPKDNVFRCDISLQGDVAAAAIAPGVVVYAASDRAGPAYVAVDPADILVSEQPVAASARNSLRGQVTQITQDRAGVMLEVQAGVAWRVRVTPASYERMRLRPGKRVYLTFKASSVRVL